jgi:hypothetical protein
VEYINTGVGVKRLKAEDLKTSHTLGGVGEKRSAAFYRVKGVQSR